MKQLANKPFALIGINSDRDLNQARTMVNEKDITWRSFWNGPDGPGGPIAARWNVRSWPTVHILDSQGKIRFRDVSGKKMDRAIEELLLEMGHEVQLVR